MLVGLGFGKFTPAAATASRCLCRVPGVALQGLGVVFPWGSGVCLCIGAILALRCSGAALPVPLPAVQLCRGLWDGQMLRGDPQGKGWGVTGFVCRRSSRGRSSEVSAACFWLSLSGCLVQPSLNYSIKLIDCFAELIDPNFSNGFAEL